MPERLYATIQAENGRFIVETSQSVSSIAGASVYLGILSAKISDDGKTLTVPFDGDGHETYELIRNILEDRLDMNIKVLEAAALVMHELEQEREKFANFSEKAREIRNDTTDLEEFRAFTRSTENLQRELRYFQLLAAYHLAYSQNACNFSVPGSGKTTFVYATYNFFTQLSTENNKHLDKILVIGPIASFKAWKDEYEECFGRLPSVFEIFGGIKIEKVAEVINVSNVQPEIILINYDSVPSLIPALKNFIKNNKVMIVLDEAHRIKKIDGFWSSSVLQLSMDAKSRVVLTGTPAPNGYEDLYNFFKFIWPNKNIIGFSAGQLARMSKNTNDLRVNSMIKKIEPFFIRTTKAQLKLPEPKFINPINVPMDEIQQKIYSAFEGNLEQMQHDLADNKIRFKSNLIRLRQAASNPNLLNTSLKDYYQNSEEDDSQSVKLIDNLFVSPEIKTLISKYSTNNTPAKFIRTMQIIRGLISCNEKVIIWCEFIQTIKDLSEYLNKSDINHRLLFGEVSKEEREQIIDEIHENDNIKVVIANPHAVGESISLHKAVHNAVYLEQGYNAAAYMQSKDRIHRVGLEDNDEIRYYFIHSEDTVESVIYEAVKNKEKRMLEIIESNEIPLFVNNSDFTEDNENDFKKLIRYYYDKKARLV